MKIFIVLIGLGLVTGCSTPEIKSSTPDRAHERLRSQTSPPRAPVSESRRDSIDTIDLNQLQAKLGLNRANQSLGYVEKAFDSCQMGLRDEGGKCGPRFFAVVNFRLVCRDSEDTVEQIVSNMTPVVTDQVKWSVNGLVGVAKTDASGYGTLQVLTPKSMRGRRLVLTVGKQFLGVDISEVRQIVVPVYWCTQLSSISRSSRSLAATSVLSKIPEP